MPRGVYERKKVGKPTDSAFVPMSLVSHESDEQIHDRLKMRFDVLERMTKTACDGTIRSMIVSGPPGLGKSYTVEQAIKAFDPKGTKTAIVKGFMRPTGIYKTFHKHQNKGHVVVFDDCDSIFFDTDGLNLLKIAADTTDRRTLTWGAETRMQDDTGAALPWNFDFEGSLIMITNYDFDYAIDKEHRLSEHFAAMISRSHYIDTSMKSLRDYIIRIKMVVNECQMLRGRGFDENAEQIILRYIEDNALKLRELTLRMVIKISDLYKAEPLTWRDTAAVTLHKQ